MCACVMSVLHAISDIVFKHKGSSRSELFTNFQVEGWVGGEGGGGGWWAPRQNKFHVKRKCVIL